MGKSILLFLLLAWSISGSPGHAEELDGPEQLAMSETLQHALEYNRTGEESSWVNPDTGHSGALAPVQTYHTGAGRYCREFVQTIVIGGKEEQGYGTACRQPDGAWKIVDPEKVGTGAVRVVTSYRYIYHDPYSLHYPWAYYAPAWYPHRLFFSFSFRHDRHFHRDHFRDRRHGGHKVIWDDRRHRDFRYRSWVHDRHRGDDHRWDREKRHRDDWNRWDDRRLRSEHREHRPGHGERRHDHRGRGNESRFSYR